MNVDKTRIKASRVHIESWFWAIVFISSFLLVAFTKLGSTTTPNDEFVEFNNARLEEFARNPARYKVILLGDSRLKYASLPDRDLESRAEMSQVDVAFLRVVHNRAEFADFEPFLETILQMRPDLVVLQKPLLYRKRTENVDLRKLQKFIVWSLVDGEGSWNPDGVDQANLQFGTPCAGPELWPDAEDVNQQELDALINMVKSRGAPDPDGPNANMTRVFIATATANATRVVILRLPAMPFYYEIMARAFPDYPINGDMPEVNTVEWTYPGEFTSGDYCDILHLNAAARSTHTEWLMSRALQELPAAERALHSARRQ